MKQKLLDLLENHVDKLILGVIAIASLGILWFFVISNPYAADFRRKPYGPGKIDAAIRKDAVDLGQRINGKATEQYRKYPDNKAGQYLAKMASTVKVNEKAIARIVRPDSSDIGDKRFYRRPLIPAVEDADAQVMRTAVFVPTEKVEMTMPYEMAQTEVSDIDFITGVFPP